MRSQIQWFFGRKHLSDSTLANSADTIDNLLGSLAGQTVAIVGNSRALSDAAHGAAIDAADIVIRINRAPMPSTVSHGTRTDWLALATSLAPTEHRKLNPSRTLWMSHKRKRLRRWMTQTNGFYLHPIAAHRVLFDELTAPPTTGLMIIDLVSRSQAHSANIYGFDFFQSKSLTGSRSAAQVPHDFSAEKNWVNRLIDRDARFTINI
ncbi:MAG: glycosyltransferase family 29 protein [Paracoccaceae bacterium]